MSYAIRRLLNLKSGDMTRGWPFFVYLFLIIASYVLFQACSQALFLDKYQATDLPYGDIAIAVTVGGLVALYLRASRRMDLKNLLIISLLLFSANAFAFWWAEHYSTWSWVSPILYVWVGIFGVLAPAQVWTLTNFVWTTREAKRLFTLLGSGAILGGIFGGLIAKVAANRYGAESLLIIAGTFILLCVVLVEIIWRHRHIFDTAGRMDEASEDTSERSLKKSIEAIRGSRLLQTIAILICVGSTSAAIAGWQYKAIAQSMSVDKDALASFFGEVMFYTGVLSLLAQILLTSRVLRRFGIGVALLILPVALVVGSVGVLISSSIIAAQLLRASDKVFRYSLDKSSMELLYLPIPGDVKLQAKSFLDTVVWRFGDGLAGFTVLIFANVLAFSVREVAWVNLVFLTAWIAVALIAKRQYIATLSSNMQELELDPQRNSAPVLDALTTNMFVVKLSSKDDNEILSALNLFEMGHEHGAHSAVHQLLEHPSADVRKRAISVLTSSGDKSARALVAPLLQDKSLEVRTEALLYMMRNHHFDPLHHIQELSDFADYTLRSATVAFLSRPGESENLVAARFFMDTMVNEQGPEGRRARLEAARLIGSLPDHFTEQLGRLLKDSDAEVVRHAIRAAGLLGKREFAPLLIRQLSDPRLREDAAYALLHFENSVIDLLCDCLADASAPIEVRRAIPQILVAIGTPEAMRILADNVVEADNVLRYRIIASLNKLADLNLRVEIDSEAIETVLVAEIMGHYRSYQILASTNGEPANALRESISEELERIFRLMKLLSPEHDLRGAYMGLQSKDPVLHANALEFLDNALNPQLRSLLVPLIDSDVSETERARLAERVLRIKMHSAAAGYEPDGAPRGETERRGG
jgi:AAA family ATP:ADP antiporter